jgi:hypothetical protein
MPKAKRRFTDYEIREMWKSWGGSFHGPHVETATMPETNFFAMMRAILNKDLPTPRQS